MARKKLSIGGCLASRRPQPGSGFCFVASDPRKLEYDHSDVIPVVALLLFPPLAAMARGSRTSSPEPLSLVSNAPLVSPVLLVGGASAGSGAVEGESCGTPLRVWSRWAPNSCIGIAASGLRFGVAVSRAIAHLELSEMHSATSCGSGSEPSPWTRSAVSWEVSISQMPSEAMTSHASSSMISYSVISGSAITPTWVRGLAAGG